MITTQQRLSSQVEEVTLLAFRLWIQKESWELSIGGYGREEILAPVRSRNRGGPKGKISEARRSTLWITPLLYIP